MLKRSAAVLAVASLAASISAGGSENPSGEASGFISEAPAAIAAKLTSTNDTTGTFIQTKTTPDGAKYVCRGTYAIHPGRSFEWRISDPFDALFYADLNNYVYSNEDECVKKPLDNLPGFSRFRNAESGDFSDFFKVFDVLYKEDPPGVANGAPFHVLAKPKEPRIAKFLERVDADGTSCDWTLRAKFPNGTTFEVRFTDDPRK